MEYNVLPKNMTLLSQKPIFDNFKWKYNIHSERQQIEEHGESKHMSEK